MTDRTMVFRKMLRALLRVPLPLLHASRDEQCQEIRGMILLLGILRMVLEVGSCNRRSRGDIHKQNHQDHHKCTNRIEKVDPKRDF